MLYLNIFEQQRNFPHDYLDYYSRDEAISYTIYKDSRNYIIHNPKAPYAIECNLGKNGDIFFPCTKEDDETVISRYDINDLNILPKANVRAINNRPPEDSNARFVLTSNVNNALNPSIPMVDTMLNFLNDKIKIFKLQIAKRGIQFSVIESNGKGVEYVDVSEIEDEEQIDEATTDTDQKDKKQNKKQEVAYTSYKLFLSEIPSHDDYKKMKKWKSSQNKFPITIYEKDELSNNNYKILFDRYNEEDNTIIVKSYPSKEKRKNNERQKKLQHIENGYITEEIFKELVLHDRQMKNTKSFQEKNFSLKTPFLNPETISNVVNPTSLEWNNKLLTDDQKRAVLTALGSSPIIAVNGPPGTGKTTVITEMVYQFALQEKSIWISSQTNLAIDNVLERLAKDERIRPERRGNQDRVKDKLFNSELSVAHYFEHQHLDKLEEFVNQYEKSITEYNKYKAIYDDIIKLERKIEKISEEIEQARNSEDAPQVQLFLKWLDNPEYTPHNLKKHIWKKYCEELHNIHPFLDNIDDYLWKENAENISNELRPRMENLYTEIRSSNNSEIRKRFEFFINELKQKYPQTNQNSTFSISDKNTEIEKINKDIEQLLKNSGFNSIDELRNVISSTNISKKDNEKYEFYKKLLKLPRINKNNANLVENTYKGICKYTPNLIGATCNISPFQLFLSAKTDTRNNLPIEEFDVVIVDEVSKFTTVEMFVLAMFGKKLILIGDHHQLPPVFKEGREVQRLEDVMEELKYDIQKFNDNFKEYEKHLAHSHFESVWKTIAPESKVALTTQFRCHPDIMNIFNLFYQNDPEINGLICGISPENRIHPYTPPWNPNSKNVVWLDSSSTKKFEEKPENSTSTCNKYEVDIIMKALKDLYQEATEKQIKKEVGVISLYGAQVKELKDRMKQLGKNCKGSKRFNIYEEWLDIEINTVDDFQGKEKDIILVSMVRNPSDLRKLKNNPFIREYRRINVAMSRAKELLVIVGARKVYFDIDVNINECPVYVYKAILEGNRANISLVGGEEVLKNNSISPELPKKYDPKQNNSNSSNKKGSKHNA